MIALDSRQKQIATRSTSEMVTLVKLTTFSDYVAQTVDEVFYWGSVPLVYQWDGVTAQHFRGQIKSVSQVTRGFSHMPSAGELTTRDGIRITLNGAAWSGEFPWARLTAQNIIGARVEVASLLVDWPSPKPPTWRDQSALGAVHTVRFRGEVTSIPEYEDEANEFVLVCDSIEPTIAWPVALDGTQVSAADLGKRYPIPIRSARRVPMIQRTVGWISTLMASIGKETTGNVAVSDTSGFPASDDFAFYIGSERMTGNVVSANTVSITSRGASIGGVSTEKAIHEAGAVVIEEVDEAKYVFAGVPALALVDVYARSPFSGEMIRLPDEFYGYHIADKVTDPGRTIGVCSFTRSMMTQVNDRLNRESRITQQPDFSLSTDVRTESPQRTTAYASGSNNDAIVSGSDLTIEYQTGVNERGAYYWQTGDLASTSDTVSRFKITYTMTVSGGTSGLSFARVELKNSFLNSSTQISESFFAGSGATVIEGDSGWITPPGGTTVATMVNGGSFSSSGPLIDLFISQAIGSDSSGAEFALDRADLIITIEKAGSSVSQTLETIATGAQEIGFNLDLFADINGVVSLGSRTSLGQFDQIEQGATDWANAGGASLSDVGAPGDGIVITGLGTNILREAALLSISPSLNFSNVRMVFELDVTEGNWGILSLDHDAIQITLKSAANDWRTWGFPKTCFPHAGSFNEFTFDPNAAANRSIDSDGTLNLAAVVQINVNWKAQSSTNGGLIRIRNLQTEPRTYIQHPIDLAEWLIEDLAGVSGGADSSTFATAKTNLPSVVFDGDLRNAGGNFADALARIGFEARTNFVPSEAAGQTVYKAFNALTSYAFTASVRTLSEFRGLRTTMRQLDAQPTEFLGLYGFSNEFDPTDIAGYSLLIQANATTNDVSADVTTASITDAQARVGVRESIPLAFMYLPNSTAMIEVFAYYVTESLRGGSLRFAMRVPYSSGYDLEPGDIISFTPRWASSATKCRVIQTEFPFDAPSVALLLEEVS